MKSITLYIALFISSWSLNAQVTQEHHFTTSCISTMLNATDYKLYAMDAVNNKCIIYNTDYSVYKSISLSVPTNMYLYDVRFVTENLFNLDSKIELLYVYYEYVVTDAVNETGYYKYYTRIINESGSELLKIEGALYSYIYKVNESEYNLFIYGYDYSSWPYDVTTDVYSFPGQPYFLSLENTSKSASISEAYPNPAENFVNVNYTLPADVTSALLEVYSIQGTTMARYPISNQTNSFRLPTATYPSGSYLYLISADGQKSATQQLIIK